MTRAIDHEVDVGGIGPRGLRTRSRLVAAARVEFEERRYLDTNVQDIVARAGVSHGTFYTYFPSKESIFREVAIELQTEMLGRAGHDVDIEPPATLYDRIEAANRVYLEAYRAHARMMDVIEQVASFNDEIRQIRREIRQAYVERSRRTITRLQEEHLVADDVDPHYVANALGAMVDRFAYIWFVLGEPFEFDEALRTLSLLWVRALDADTETPNPYR